jgi:hypothetical protein
MAKKLGLVALFATYLVMVLVGGSIFGSPAFATASQPKWFPAKSCRELWGNRDLAKYDPAKDANITSDGNRGYDTYLARLKKSGIDRRTCFKDWTVLVYMAGDNDLSPYAIWDLEEMEGRFESGRYAGSTLKSDLIVQADTAGATGLRRLHMFQRDDQPYSAATSIADFKARGPETVRSPIVDLLPDQPPSKQGLQDFLQWGVRQYPAINDYREKDGKIVATGKPTKLCNNLINRGDLDWALPMMSRDGRRFATISPVTKTTLVFEISMPGGHCRQIADLGFGTSKVSFSYDGTMVTFPAHIAGMKNRSALVFDLHSGTYEPVLPPSESVDAYFSTFLPDGSIGVLSFKKDFMSRTSRNALGPEVSSMGDGLPVLEVERDFHKRVPATESQTKFAIEMILNCPNYSTVHPDWISRFLFREKCEALRAKHPKEFEALNARPSLPLQMEDRARNIERRDSY